MTKHQIQTLFAYTFSASLCVVSLWVCVAYLSTHTAWVTVYPIRLLNLPFARIDGHAIGTSDVFRLYEQLHYFEDLRTDDEILTEVWDHVRRTESLVQLARAYDISWTQSDLEVYESRFFAENELDREDIRIGMPLFDTRHFRTYTILPMLLEELIQRKLLVDEPSEAKEESMRLYELLRSDPSKFSDVLRERAEAIDGTYTENLGVLSPRTMSVEEAAIFRATKKGDITPIIVRKDGYRLYQIVDYFTSPEEAWSVREIFIPGQRLEERLEERTRLQKIDLYVKGIVV